MDKLGTLIKYDILGLRFVLITSKMFVSACKITYCDRQGTTEPPSPCAVTEAQEFDRLCVLEFSRGYPLADRKFFSGFFIA